ncbi:MAG: hypothetical protein LUG23_03755 [Oscillospiraceae bacterium]|nr:hypothetical protein [Oscillospiraceae bacterium]
MQNTKQKLVYGFFVVFIVAILILSVLVVAFSGGSSAEKELRAKQEYMDSCTEVTRAKLLHNTSTYLYQKVKITGTVIEYGRSKSDSSDVVMEIYPYGAASDDRIYGLFTVSSSTLSGIKQGDEITLYGVYVGEEEYNVSDGYYTSAPIRNLLGSDSPNIEIKYFTYTHK